MGLLAPIPNVFLVMPVPDQDASLRICVQRDQERFAAAGHPWDASRRPAHARFAHSECFQRVAKHTVYTHDRSVEDCVDEILGKLE